MKIAMTVMLVGIAVLFVGVMVGITNAYQTRPSERVNRIATSVSLSGGAVTGFSVLAALLIHIWR